MLHNKLIYLIAFASGLLSLAQEILWMRFISFVGMSVPQTFSFTLALFLVGIAIGAHIGKKICQKNKDISIAQLGSVFFLAAIVDLILLLGIYIFSLNFNPSVLVLGCAVLICAAIRGIIFPMVHHVGTAHAKTGKQISNVYFSNVFGSALAPILISFLALDYLNTQQVYILVCFLTFLVAIIALSFNKFYIPIAVSIFFLLFLPEKLFYQFSKNSYQTNVYPEKILENRHGIIQVYKTDKDHIVFGGNVYDGKLNTDIFHNSNGVDRAYLVAALQPTAKEVLVIGLSTGSWAKVLSLMPSVEKIRIIEINPQYVDFIRSHDEVRGLLDDPRVEIIIDDGRKWLKKNQFDKFDLILMNTTWHWRAYATNLISQDFMQIIAQHLQPNGIAFYNTTEALNAYATARKVFPYVYQYKYFALVSNQAQKVELSTIQENLCQLRDPLTGIKTFQDRDQCQLAAQQIIKNPLKSYQEIKFSYPERDLAIITDDNMLTEFKYGKGL